MEAGKWKNTYENVIEPGKITGSYKEDKYEKDKQMAGYISNGNFKYGNALWMRFR